MEKIPEKLFSKTVIITVKHSYLSHTLIVIWVRTFRTSNHEHM
jgi:hypothetical protein